MTVLKFPAGIAIKKYFRRDNSDHLTTSSQQCHGTRVDGHYRPKRITYKPEQMTTKYKAWKSAKKDLLKLKIDELYS